MRTIEQKMKAYWPELNDADMTDIESKDLEELAQFLAERFRISHYEAKNILSQMGVSSSGLAGVEPVHPRSQS